MASTLSILNEPPLMNTLTGHGAQTHEEGRLLWAAAGEAYKASVAVFTDARDLDGGARILAIFLQADVTFLRGQSVGKSTQQIHAKFKEVLEGGKDRPRAGDRSDLVPGNLVAFDQQVLGSVNGGY